MGEQIFGWSVGTIIPNAWASVVPVFDNLRPYLAWFVALLLFVQLRLLLAQVRKSRNVQQPTNPAGGGDKK